MVIIGNDDARPATRSHAAKGKPEFARRFADRKHRPSAD